jgi:hypothetical protein
LTPEQLERYQGCYCGLCRTIGRQYGWSGRLTLSYDLTFLTLLLSSLYEAPENNGLFRCFVHPMRKRPYWLTKYTEYTADISIALAYYNCLDDWKDEHKKSSWVYARLLYPKYLRVKAKHPEHCRNIEACLTQLSTIEAKKEPIAADEAAACFGRLLGDLFVYDPKDYWAKHLYATGETLGKFIYLMDACLDLAADRKDQRYNPLLYTDAADDEEYQLELLTMLISDCTLEFEKLPILQDVVILKNILYNGVWQKYKMATDPRREGKQP